MKVLFALAAGSLFCSCANDTPPAEDVREHFQRGMSGEGQLAPIDRPDDPFIQPRTGNSAPSHP